MESASQHVIIPAGDVALEAVLTPVPTACVAAVIAHPYPLFGGDMNDPVVIAIESALQACSVTTLRFNFRGTGSSTGSFDRGRGEQDDVAASASYLIGLGLAKQVILSGYSFGAIVTLHAADRIPAAAAIVAVAPPLSRMPLADRPPPSSELFVIGDRDRYCSIDDARRFGGAWPGRRSLEVIAGADHNLLANLGDLRRRIEHHVSAWLSPLANPRA